jgi:hypothetical protein
VDLFDFIKQEEIDDLPEDPAIAFMTFVRLAQGRLAQRTRELDTDQEQDWEQLREARFGFQNVVLAAGKRYRIEPFLSLQMPKRDNYNKHGADDYRQFKADLDHFMTQLVLDSSDRAKRDSVIVSLSAKEKIRNYINGLKTAIDQSNFSEAKRASLLDTLGEFEKELEKKRLSIVAVARIVLEILAVPGTIWGSYEIVSRLTTNILEVVGEEKAADDSNRRLPPAEPPAALLPPRKEGASSEEGLDDDIPF